MGSNSNIYAYNTNNRKNMGMLNIYSSNNKKKNNSLYNKIEKSIFFHELKQVAWEETKYE